MTIEYSLSNTRRKGCFGSLCFNKIQNTTLLILSAGIIKYLSSYLFVHRAP